MIQPTLAEAQEQATAQATTVIEALKAADRGQGYSDGVFSVTILRDYSENADPTQIPASRS